MVIFIKYLNGKEPFFYFVLIWHDYVWWYNKYGRIVFNLQISKNIKFVVNFMIILYNTWVLMISKRGLILSKIYGKGEKNEKNG